MECFDGDVRNFHITLFPYTSIKLCMENGTGQREENPVREMFVVLRTRKEKDHERRALHSEHNEYINRSKRDVKGRYLQQFGRIG